jgi:hypothetical protein
MGTEGANRRREKAHPPEPNPYLFQTRIASTRAISSPVEDDAYANPLVVHDTK